MKSRRFVLPLFLRPLVKAIAALLLLAASMSAALVYADQSCSRVDAYWETNLTKLVENMSECTFQNWQKCSQAAAIHYDLNIGSLFHRAQDCGLSKPETPDADYITHQDTDSKQCLAARDTLRKVFENRAQARLACSAARAGGEDQEWLDSQCTLFRARMANYHTPFHKLAQSCGIDEQETVALRLK